MNVVTIGGGSGTPIINEALLLAGFKNIKSIVTVMDSGGLTGRMRTDSSGQEVAYSDGLRTLLSLIPPKFLSDKKIKSLKELLLKRDSKSQIGYIIFSHFFDKETGFSKIKEILEQLTGLKFLGEVLPVTTASTNLVFETESGQRFLGEHELDDKRMSTDTVKDMWLEPEAIAFPQALEAIRSANLIIFSCGSLHGSVLSNLLPKGVVDVLRHSKAVKILVTNLASSRNETHHFTIPDFVSLFTKYGQDKHFLDLIIAPDIDKEMFEKRYPKVATRYAMEHSHFLGWSKPQLELWANKLNIEILTHRATSVDPKKFRLRHDPKKLAKVFRKLLI